MANEKNPKVLIVDDDKNICDLLRLYLEKDGYSVLLCHDGDDAVVKFKALSPDMVLLHIMLPGKDGIELLKLLKDSPKYMDIPVIMATAKGAEFDKVKGLDLGADDYLVKPFGMMEMISRVKAVLRRCTPARKEEKAVLTAGCIRLSPEERTVFVDEKRIALTYKEFELLTLFMKNKGKVFTRDVLFNEIWGSDFIGETRTVDMHIRTLRQKLGNCGEMIETVRNVGYRMEAEHDN